MCVIVYKPKKADITRKKLLACWNDNPDGAGFMYASENVLHIHKGFMTFRKFYRRYRECERKNSDSNFAIHFRIATHGKVNPNNCHPFYVNEKTGFMHNGTLNCLDVTKNSSKSDTMIFNEDVLKKLPKNFLKRKEYNILLNSIAKAELSKFAIMDNKGTCYLFNESAGTWKQGIWYSSSVCDFGFSDYKRELFCYTANKCSNKLIYNEDWIECLYCGDYYPLSECVDTGAGFVCPVCAKETEASYTYPS